MHRRISLSELNFRLGLACLATAPFCGFLLYGVVYTYWGLTLGDQTKLALGSALLIIFTILTSISLGMVLYYQRQISIREKKKRQRDV